MTPITATQRRQAETRIDSADRSLREAIAIRNLDSQTRAAIGEAIDSVSSALALLASQPNAPR